MKTKKYLLLLVFFFTIIVSRAQEQKDDIAVKKGNFNAALNIGYLTPYTFDNDFKNAGAPIGLGFGYAVSNHLIVGAEFGVFTLTTRDYKETEVVTDQNGTASISSYSYNVSYKGVFFMGSIQYHWRIKEKSSFYSGLSIGSQSGSTSLNFSDGQTRADITVANVSGAAYQLTALGMRSFFSKNFGFHFEIGYGIKGIAGGGIDIKF